MPDISPEITDNRFAEALRKLWKSLRKYFISANPGQQTDSPGNTDIPRKLSAPGFKDNRDTMPEIESFLSDGGNNHVVFIFTGLTCDDKDMILAWLGSRKMVKAIFMRCQPDIFPECLMNNPDTKSGRILIAGQEGVSNDIYQYADVAFIGRGLHDNGNAENGNDFRYHTIEEIIVAASYGLPVMYDMQMLSIPQAENLKILGGGIALTSADSFARNADRLVFDCSERRQRGKWAKEYVEELMGKYKNKKIDCHPDNQSSVNLKI